MKNPILFVLLAALTLPVQSKALATLVTYSGGTNFVEVAPDNPWGLTMAHDDPRHVSFTFSFIYDGSASASTWGSYRITGNGITVQRSGAVNYASGLDEYYGEQYASISLGNFWMFFVPAGFPPAPEPVMLHLDDLFGYANYGSLTGMNFDDGLYLSEAEFSQVPDTGATSAMFAAGLCALLLHRRVRNQGRSSD